MITVIGLHNDNTVSHFMSNANVPIHMFDLHELVGSDWRFDLPPTTAQLKLHGQMATLDPDGSYYCRITDLSSVSESKEESLRWRGFITALCAWLETIPGTVVNRPGHACDNSAKPLHEWWLQQCGFAVPASLTSSEAERLANFTAAGATVVKTLSGVRANCRIVTPDEFQFFDPRRGPVHLQRQIKGFDVRAHVVKDRVFAEKIVSTEVDYRINSDRTDYLPYKLPNEIEEKLVYSSHAAGLIFAGWDFKVDANGIFWCLEANPMPGYNAYDRRLGGVITRALVDVLS